MQRNEQKDTPLVVLIKQSQLLDVDLDIINTYEGQDSKEEVKDVVEDNLYNDEQAIEGRRKHIANTIEVFGKRQINLLKAWNQAQTEVKAEKGLAWSQPAPKAHLPDNVYTVPDLILYLQKHDPKVAEVMDKALDIVLEQFSKEALRSTDSSLPQYLDVDDLDDIRRKLGKPVDEDNEDDLGNAL